GARVVEQGIESKQSTQRVPEQGLTVFVNVEALFDLGLYLIVDEIEEGVSSSCLRHIEVNRDQIIRGGRCQVEISPADNFFLIVGGIANANKYSFQGWIFRQAFCRNRQHP